MYSFLIHTLSLKLLKTRRKNLFNRWRNLCRKFASAMEIHHENIIYVDISPSPADPGAQPRTGIARILITECPPRKKIDFPTKKHIFFGATTHTLSKIKCGVRISTLEVSIRTGKARTRPCRFGRGTPCII